ncbi:MAG: nitroreductase family protein [Deltaproteobacteria bacterium]|nr:nitroreductase family protein [Deltaproteobacteria bacterium]
MDFKDVVNQRRAVNFFDPQKAVSDELIREMIGMAAKAPSSFNLQPWSLMILRNPDEKMRLRKQAFDQPKVTEAPVVFIVLADRDGWKKGHPFAEKNFREMVKAGTRAEDQYDGLINTWQGLYGATEEKQQAFACKNTGFFAMSLMYAAKRLGLESHPMDGFDHEGVRKEFRIPQNYWVPLLLAVGYFDEKKKLGPPKWRKSFEEIVVRFD